MIKIFLVEDEMVILNAVKNSIDWNREGYELVGEASDGELAYPLIKNTKPDILITDIRMPFMNGLELSSLVKKELKDIKIVLLSGYNEFEYAKKAIEIGVTDYLMKPITADKLMESIKKVADTIRKERKERENFEYYIQELQENIEHEKFEFFNQLVSGTMSMSETLDRGKRLGMDLSAAMYNILLFKFLNREEDEAIVEERIAADIWFREFLQGTKHIYAFGRGVEGWAILFTAENSQELLRREKEFVEHVCTYMNKYESIEFYGGMGNPVNRVRELKRCFKKADLVFASRFVNNSNQILSEERLKNQQMEDSDTVSCIGNMQCIRDLIEKFLRGGMEKEVDRFVETVFFEIPAENLKSLIMRQYIVMDIYVSIHSFWKDLEVSENELQEVCGDIKQEIENVGSLYQVKAYIKSILRCAITLRNIVAARKYSAIIELAKKYIEENYMSEDISLNTIAAKVNLSPSYFSTIFSQEVGKTFVKYLTEVRMEKAKELLMCSTMKSTEIGYEVGYKDSHYFSFIFKKTQKCTPKEYRQLRKQ